jgi:hypothetical protein
MPRSAVALGRRLIWVSLSSAPARLILSPSISLESFHFPEPAFALGFGDAGAEVVADLGEALSLDGVGPEHGAAGVLVGAVGRERAPAGSGGDLAAKWPRNCCHSSSARTPGRLRPPAPAGHRRDKQGLRRWHRDQRVRHRPRSRCFQARAGAACQDPGSLPGAAGRPAGRVRGGRGGSWRSAPATGLILPGGPRCCSVMIRG